MTISARPTDEELREQGALRECNSVHGDPNGCGFSTRFGGQQDGLGIQSRQLQLVHCHGQYLGSFRPHAGFPSQ